MAGAARTQEAWTLPTATATDSTQFLLYLAKCVGAVGLCRLFKIMGVSRSAVAAVGADGQD